MKHDPARHAAEYLDGSMGTRRRSRFEDHLLGCADCWSEVSLARGGREVAESLRLLAPQRLRDDVRAAVLGEESGRDGARIPRTLVAAGVATLVVALVATGLAILRPAPQAAQPGSIAQAVADFREGRIPAERPARRRAPDLREIGFAVSGEGAGRVGGIEADGFSYIDDRGRRLQLYISTETFPEAEGAEMLFEQPGSPWMAASRGVRLLCSERPFPLLALSEDPAALAALSVHLGIAGTASR